MASPHLLRFLRHGFATALVVATGLATAAAPAQAPAADPALADQLKELKTMVGDSKMAADFQAVQFLKQKLMAGLETRSPKDKERLAKGLGEVFRTGKVRPADKQLLYTETANALAKLGADGAKELLRAASDKRFEDFVPLVCELVRALGQTQDEKQIEWLLETTIRSPRDEVKGAAGEALGNFAMVDIKVRREVVKGMVREWGSLHALATQRDNPDPNAPIDSGPQNARRTLQVVETKWNGTLQKLTGQSFSKFEEWQRWANKNPNWNSGGKQ